MTELSGSVLMTPKNGWKYGSVGKVVSGCKIKVIGLEDGKLLGPNEVGEIMVKCKGIMKKYLYANDKEKMEKNDILDEDGFFHTGDVGYYDDEGYFFIVDRIKELIKYKGFQVCFLQCDQNLYYLLILKCILFRWLQRNWKIYF